MVEPLSVLGGVAAGIQLFKYGIRLLGHLYDIPGDLRSAPDTIHDLLEEVDIFVNRVQSLEIESGASTDAAQLQALVIKYRRLAESMQDNLQSLKANPSDRRYKRWTKSAKFLKESKRISKLHEDITRCQATLHFFLTSVSFQERQSRHPVQHATGTTLPNRMDLERIAMEMPAKSEYLDPNGMIDLVSEVLTHPSSGRKAALVGLGGIGKSQAALEYVYRILRTSTDISVFWIQASNRANFEEGFLRIGQHAGLFGSNGIVDLKAPDVTEWLQSDRAGQWILIVDDIDLATFGDKQAFYRILPKTNNGSIIFTTRNKQAAYDLVSPSNIIVMNSMTATHAHQLLNSRLGYQVPFDQHVESLLRRLSYLPLAITQAAAYMYVTSMSVPAYLKLVEDSEQCVFNLPQNVDTSTRSSTNLEALTLVSLVSIDAIRHQNHDASDLLFSMACMKPFRIPKDLFMRGRTSVDIANAFGLLKAYSLITIDDSDSIIEMHSLVHLAVWSYLKTTSQLNEHLRRCFDLLSEEFPPESEQHKDLNRCNLYFPHAVHMWRLATEELDLPGIPAIDHCVAEHLASRISRYLRINGRYDEARKFAQSALEYSCKSSGPHSSRSLICRRNLAIIDQYSGNNKASEEVIDSILRSQLKNLDGNDPDIISTLNEKGLCLQSQGRCAEAEEYHQEAVSICETLYGADDLRTLDQLQNLGLAFMGQGNYAVALDHLQRAVDGLEEMLGLKNTRTLSALVNMSCVLQYQGRWEASRKLLSQALAGREEVLGPHHPHTLHCKANLAQIYRQQGDLPKAEQITREVLQMHQAKLGKDHPTTLHIHRNLGLLLQCQARYDEAEEVFLRVARGRERKLGARHCDTLTSTYDLSVIYQCQERRQEALELGKKARDARRETLDEGHVDRLASERHVRELEQDYEEWLQTRTLVDSGEEGDG